MSFSPTPPTGLIINGDQVWLTGVRLVQRIHAEGRSVKELKELHTSLCNKVSFHQPLWDTKSPWDITRLCVDDAHDVILVRSVSYVDRMKRGKSLRWTSRHDEGMMKKDRDEMA